MSDNNAQSASYSGRGLLSKLATYGREEGLWALLGRALATPFNKLCSSQTILEFARNDTAPRPVITARIAAVAKELCLEDLPALDAVMYHSTTTIRARFARGERCFAALVDECIACYAWVVAGAPARDTAQLVLGAEDFYIYNVRTARAMRGNGLYPFLLQAICDQLFAAGFRQALIRAESANRASVKGIEKAGFTQRAVFQRQCRLGKTREQKIID
jgi:hypothetical protein